MQNITVVYSAVHYRAIEFSIVHRNEVEGRAIARTLYKSNSRECAMVNMEMVAPDYTLQAANKDNCM